MYVSKTLTMNKVKTQGNNCVLFVAMLSPVN